MQLFGLGFWEYVHDGFNIFDAFVVLVSLVELMIVAAVGLNSLRWGPVLDAPFWGPVCSRCALGTP